MPVIGNLRGTFSFWFSIILSKPNADLSLSELYHTDRASLIPCTPLNAPPMSSSLALYHPSEKVRRSETQLFMWMGSLLAGFEMANLDTNQDSKTVKHSLVQSIVNKSLPTTKMGLVSVQAGQPDPNRQFSVSTTGGDSGLPNIAYDGKIKDVVSDQQNFMAQRCLEMDAWPMHGRNLSTQLFWQL